MKTEHDIEKEIEDIQKLISGKIKMEEATVRKSYLDENGMTYEVEKKIEIPVFPEQKTKDSDLPR